MGRLGITTTVAEVHPMTGTVPIVTGPAFAIGDAVRIVTEQYGKSYKGERGTVVGFDYDGWPLVQVRPSKRKSPLVVMPDSLKKLS